VPGKIVNEALILLKHHLPDMDKMTVRTIIMGLGYTAAELNTGHVGICCSLQKEISPECCQVHKRAGELAGSRVGEIAAMAKSFDLSESVIGIATLNALSSIAIAENPDSYMISKGNVLEDLIVKKRDFVAFVGNMIPLVNSVREKAAKICVLERDLLRRQAGVLPDTACEEILPKADVVIITGSAIANGTIDRLTELSQGAREIALVGASASIIPDPLFKAGVTVVAGIRVENPKRLLQIVSEGGGTQQLKKAVEFVNVRKRKH
jgi:uncharacterized protein (DUF4213/DUF364 family)